VLTDERYFKGSDADLTAVRAAVDVPVLRKDFVVDPYQVYEARALGADAVLLIVRALSRDEIVALSALADSLGMAALVEAHTAEEIGVALDAGATLLGINNRDLTRMVVDVATTERLRPLVPSGVTLVSESGIRTPDDITRLRVIGVDARWWARRW
jgi:indole-3-glycerol phosphate synthase